MKRPPPLLGLIMVALTLTRVAPGTESPTAPLQLVGEVDGRDRREFIVERGTILMRDGEANCELPRAIRWRLDGDLRANAGKLFLCPEQWIVARPAVDATLASPVRRYAMVQVLRGWPWTDAELAGTVVVCGWIVDGQVKVVGVDTPPAHDRVPAGTALMWAFELPAGAENGSALVAVFRDGELVAPRPWFREPEANDVLASVYFGSDEDVKAAVARLSPPHVVSANLSCSLLHLAAASGRVSAVEALLAMRLNADPRDAGNRTPLHRAAALGREHATSLLISGGARREVRDWTRATPLERAIDYGHLRLGCLLLPADRGASLAHLTELAVRHADVPQLEWLLAHGAQRYVPKLDRAIWQDGVARHNADLMRLLRGAGLKEPKAAKASATGDHREQHPAGPVRGPEETDAPPAILRAEPVDAFTVKKMVVPTLGMGSPPLWMINEGNSNRDEWAVVAAIVKVDGTPSIIDVISAASDTIATAAERAVRQYTFLPAQIAGQAVRSRTVVVVSRQP